MMRTLGSLILAAALAGACAGAALPDASSQTAPAPRSPGPPSSGPGVTASDEPTVAPSTEPASAPSADASTGPSDEAVAVLDVLCGTGAPVLASRVVRTSARGVRFRVTGQKGWEFGVDHALGHESVALDAASETMVLAIPPGDVKIDCGDPTAPTELATTPLRIEDPDGWYRTAVIADGAGTCVSESRDYAAGARGKPEPPLRQAHQLLHGLQAGDVLERAGYASVTGLVRVVRAGNVIGRLEFDRDGHGGWLLAGSTMCGGLSSR